MSLSETNAAVYEKRIIFFADTRDDRLGGCESELVGWSYDIRREAIARVEAGFRVGLVVEIDLTLRSCVTLGFRCCFFRNRAVAADDILDFFDRTVDISDNA